MTEEQKPADQSNSGPSKQKFVERKFTEEKLIDLYFECVDDKDGKLADQHVIDFKILSPSIENRMVVMPLFVQAIFDEVTHVLPILFRVFPDIKDMTNKDGLHIGHFAAAVNNKAICDLCKEHGVVIDESDQTFQQKVELATKKITFHAKDKWGRKENKGSLKTVLMEYKYHDKSAGPVNNNMDELRQRMEDSLDWHKQHQQDRQAGQDAQGVGGLAEKFGQLCTVL